MEEIKEIIGNCEEITNKYETLKENYEKEEQKFSKIIQDLKEMIKNKNCKTIGIIAMIIIALITFKKVKDTKKKVNKQKKKELKQELEEEKFNNKYTKLVRQNKLKELKRENKNVFRKEYNYTNVLETSLIFTPIALIFLPIIIEIILE